MLFLQLHKRRELLHETYKLQTLQNIRIPYQIKETQYLDWILLSSSEVRAQPRSPGKALTIPERNQEAILYLQELTSALLIQKLIQVHLTDNISPDYQVIPLPHSIYN